MFNKFFNKTTAVSKIDWNSLPAVVEAFRSRVIGWYFEPLATFPVTGHEAFPVLISTCIVVGIGSEYFYLRQGEPAERYQAALKEISPIFAEKDYAARFYDGVFRSLVSVYRLSDDTGISGTGAVATLDADSGVLVFDPWVFRNAVRDWINEWCNGMIATPNSHESAVFMSNIRRDFC